MEVPNTYGVDLSAFDSRFSAVKRLRRCFEYDHLPPHLQEVSMVFASMAVKMLDMVPDTPDLTEALRKLWEVKNLVVLNAARPGSGT